jgi:Ca2+/Na+ antiporter
MMAVGESAIYYPHHEGGYAVSYACLFMMWLVNLWFIFLIMKVCSLLLSEFMMRDVNFMMCLAICYPHS